jgi:hypothetical protein
MTKIDHSVRIVNSNCLLVDCCAGVVLKPLPSARFKYICDVDTIGAVANDRALVTVPTAAANLGFKAKTLYNWIESEKLRQEHGLRHFGKRWRIDWAVFKECCDRGEFGSCS